MLTAAQQWDNLNGMWQWVNAHPLPDSETSGDRYETRQLLIAALVKAQAKLQGTDTAGATAAFAAARRRYEQFNTGATALEMPGAFSLWLANIGLDTANPLKNASTILVVLIVVIVVVALFGRRK